MSRQIVYLSPSRVGTRESCPRMYYYQYVLKWRPAAQSATLLYGSAIHTAIESVLYAQAVGRQIDGGHSFVNAWHESIAAVSVNYSDGWDENSLKECGLRSMAEFQIRWTESGNQPFLDKRGAPVIERAIAVDVGQGVILRMKLDALVITPELKVEIIDWKTPRNPSPEGYVLVADQTLAYQMGVEAIGDELGLDKIDGVGFVELFKKKRGAEVCFQQHATRRPNSQVDEFVTKLHWTANEIRNNYYPRKAGMAFNSSCSLCTFVNHCHNGTFEGINMDSVKSSMEDEKGKALTLVPTIDIAA
jgi:hypothetical protein